MPAYFLFLGVGHSAWRTSYEAIVEESSQQSSDTSFGIGENRPTSVATSGPWLLGSPGKQRPTFHPTALQSPVHSHETFQADKGRRSPAFVAPRTPSREQAQVHSGNREVTSRRASPHEISNSDLVDPPKVIRFNSLHNPVPETWASRPSEHGDSEGRCLSLLIISTLSIISAQETIHNRRALLSIQIILACSGSNILWYLTPSYPLLPQQGNRPSSM